MHWGRLSATTVVDRGSLVTIIMNGYNNDNVIRMLLAGHNEVIVVLIDAYCWLLCLVVAIDSDGPYRLLFLVADRWLTMAMSTGPYKRLQKPSRSPCVAETKNS